MEKPFEFFKDAPEEIIFYMMGFLDLHNLLKSRLVSSEFKRIAEDVINHKYNGIPKLFSENLFKKISFATIKKLPKKTQDTAASLTREMLELIQKNLEPLNDQEKIEFAKEISAHFSGLHQVPYQKIDEANKSIIDFFAEKNIKNDTIDGFLNVFKNYKSPDIITSGGKPIYMLGYITGYLKDIEKTFAQKDQIVLGREKPSITTIENAFRNDIFESKNFYLKVAGTVTFVCATAAIVCFLYAIPMLLNQDSSNLLGGYVLMASAVSLTLAGTVTGGWGFHKHISHKRTHKWASQLPFFNGSIPPESGEVRLAMEEGQAPQPLQPEFPANNV